MKVMLQELGCALNQSKRHTGSTILMLKPKDSALGSATLSVEQITVQVPDILCLARQV